MDEILKCDHSYETSLSVLVHGAVGFSAFYKVNLKNLTSVILWSERVKDLRKALTMQFWAICARGEDQFEKSRELAGIKN